MEKKYPVLYYDLENIDFDTLVRLVEQLEEYFNRENIPFLLLPKNMNLEYLTKERALEELKRLEEYVKTWE